MFRLWVSIDWEKEMSRMIERGWREWGLWLLGRLGVAIGALILFGIWIGIAWLWRAIF